MFSDRFFEAKQFTRHLRQASGPHGVHSPLVYELITRVLSPKNRDSIFNSIENERKNLRNNNTLIPVVDFGAGSRSNGNNVRRVSDIARSALQSPRCAQSLYKLANHFKSENILELGTSLGVTTSYLAYSNHTRQVWTLEGAPGVAQVAEKVFSSLGISNAKVEIGDFGQTLDPVLQEMSRVDFALIDGHHLYEPTLKYFEQISKFCHEGSIIVLDDIHWSPGMKAAWDEIRAKPEISLSLDFFHFGVLFFLQRPQKEHFKLRLP